MNWNWQSLHPSAPRHFENRQTPTAQHSPAMGWWPQTARFGKLPPRLGSWWAKSPAIRLPPGRDWMMGPRGFGSKAEKKTCGEANKKAVPMAHVPHCASMCQYWKLYPKDSKKGFCSGAPISITWDLSPHLEDPKCTELCVRSTHGTHL